MKKVIQVEKTINGKRYRKSKTINTNYKGIQLQAYISHIKMVLIKEIELKAQDTDNLADMDIKELCNYYINHIDLEETTKRTYRYFCYGMIHDFFENKKIASINKNDAYKFLDYLEKRKNEKNNRPLSQRTKKIAINTIKTLTNFLIKRDIVDKNYFNLLEIKKESKGLTKDKFYEKEEIEEIQEILLKNYDLQKYLLFILPITTGMRPGEIRGLKWKKINFDTGTIIIDESLVYVDKKDIQKSTKTNDVRNLELIPYVLNLLQKYKDDEKEKFYFLGKVFSDESYVFTNYEGKYISNSYFRIFWMNFCKKHNIRYVYPHGLRHTAATILAFNNVPLPSISKQLGHSNMQTTQIYIHAVQEAQNQINESFSNAVSNKLFLIK